MELKQLVEKIHKSPLKVCLAITGGGSEAVGLLLKYGNGSATLLDAFVPYVQEAFHKFINGIPDSYASQEASLNLAMASYQKAVGYANSPENVVGIGSTASLVKPDGERDGRIHRLHVAVQGRNFTTTYALFMDQSRSREEEELICAKVIIYALSECINEPVELNECGPLDKTVTFITDEHQMENSSIPPMIKTKTISSMHELHNEELISINYNNDNIKPTIIFSGSFNPLHNGHERMVQAVEKLTNATVGYEISISNVDKPSLDYRTITDRANQFEGKNLWISNAPKFLQKMELYPNSHFLMGADTFARFLNPSYGNLEVLEDKIKKYKTQFFICNRTNSDLPDIPDYLKEQVVMVPYEDRGESSTKIRKENGRKAKAV